MGLAAIAGPIWFARFHQIDGQVASGPYHPVALGNGAGAGHMLAVHVFGRDEAERWRRVRELFCSQDEFVAILRDGLPSLT